MLQRFRAALPPILLLSLYSRLGCHQCLLSSTFLVNYSAFLVRTSPSLIFLVKWDQLDFPETFTYFLTKRKFFFYFLKDLFTYFY